MTTGGAAAALQHSGHWRLAWCAALSASGMAPDTSGAMQTLSIDRAASAWKAGLSTPTMSTNAHSINTQGVLWRRRRVRGMA